MQLDFSPRRLRAAGSAAMLALALVASTSGVAQADWPVYGHDLANSRSAGREGPSQDQVASIRKAWTFTSPSGDFTGSPVVAGGTLVAGTNLGSIYALDTTNGKPRWSRRVDGAITGSAAIDLRAPGGPTAYLPVAKLGAPRLLALSLVSGRLRWERLLSQQPDSYVYGSPTYWKGSVFIGTSGPNSDESSARGSVVALDEATGNVRWRTFTVPPGHDGGAVWSTPAIDSSTGRLYVGTGNAYHEPAAATTDSILALSAATGRLLGHFQTTPGDVWEMNAPAGPDYDFGASPNLMTGARGLPLVGEGSKSGTYWAVGRRRMRPVWSTTVGPGSAIGGILASTAYDGNRVYGNDSVDGQVWALGRDGSSQWTSADPGTLDFAPLSVANGVVYGAGPAGFVAARDAATGRILAELPLGAPTFGGVAVAGRAVYVAVGIGPPPHPDPALPDTDGADGPGSIVAFGDTGGSGSSLTEPATTFSGSCELSGSVRFRPPLTNVPQNGGAYASVRGTCSGTLSYGSQTRALRGEPARAVTASRGLESCGAGRAAGAAYLELAGRRLRFSFDEVRPGPAPTLRASGAESGSAVVAANVSPSADPATIAKACGRTGLTDAPIDVRLRTTPSMSG